MPRTLLSLRPAVLALAVALAALPGLSRAAVEQTDVYVSGQDGYHTYRIPAIIRAQNGDLLAFAEGRKTGGGDAGNIDILLKRSADGGKTWSAQQVVWDDGENTSGNPCPVIDARTGVISLLLTHNPGTARERDIDAGKVPGRTVWLAQSKDHGATWTKAVEISSTTKDPSWRWYATGPGIGIQIKHGPHAGRLVVPSDHSYPAADSAHSERGSHAIYSDDGGKTWKKGEPIRPKMNECQVVELFDGKGTLLMDMRSYRGTKRRAQSLSTDGGVTWTEPVDAPTLVEPVCQASILRWENSKSPAANLILFSNPADEKARIKLTVRASADNAKTWSRSLELQAGPAAYSSLIALDDNAAACLYERGEKRAYEKITFARFEASDLK